MSTRAIADDYIASHYGRSKPNVSRPVPHTSGSGIEDTSGTLDEPAEKPTPSDALGQALKFIPTDVVTAYTLLLNLIPATVDNSLLWGLYAAFAILSGLAVFCQAKQQWNKLSDADKAKMPWVLPAGGVWAAVVAFLAWGAAVPGTIFARLPSYESWMGLTAVVIVTLVLNLFDGVFIPSKAKPQAKANGER
jgi:hypothetical protein